VCCLTTRNLYNSLGTHGFFLYTNTGTEETVLNGVRHRNLSRIKKDNSLSMSPLHLSRCEILSSSQAIQHRQTRATRNMSSFSPTIATKSATRSIVHRAKLIVVILDDKGGLAHLTNTGWYLLSVLQSVATPDLFSSRLEAGRLTVLFFVMVPEVSPSLRGSSHIVAMYAHW
jgi:hypothetical protein